MTRGARLAGDESELGQARRLHLRLEQDGAQNAFAGRREPSSPEPPAAFGLLLGCGHGALLVLGLEEALRGLADLDVEIRPPEAAAQVRNDVLGRQ